MQRFKTIVFNTSFALNCVLLFLLLFEQRLQVPAWLQVAGRMHPLVLHFPIVLLVLAVAWEVANFFKTPYPANARATGDGLLLAAAFTSVITALMGLFLSREGGYEPDNLMWHKWGGVFLSLLALLWYAFRNKLRPTKGAALVMGCAMLGAVIVTGHQGANITHGDDFLLAPIFAQDQKAPVILEDAEVYAHMVQPIFEAKCNSCHNERKAKGELIMETTSQLLKGGKSGALWDSTEGDLGLLLRRIHLPEESKKHMPPKGKTQLTENEIQILYRWIKGGASFTTKVMELPAEDSLRLLAAAQFENIETDNYTFEAADEKVVSKLDNAYRVVRPLALGSPALGVTFFGASQFNPKQLEELKPIAAQVVSLDLAKMPVGDGDLKNIAQFKNLRRLNLSFTRISGAGLQQLAGLSELRQLSLSGTSIKAEQLRVLAALPKLSNLYLWNTSIASQQLQTVKQYFKNVTVETGFKGDTVVLKLNPPAIQNEEQVVTGATPLKLKHYINGVAIRYTTDGTEPDSIKSTPYEKGAMIDRNMTVKAKAFKPGWISSDVVTQTFFKAGFKPDSVRLVQPPDPQYKGDGAATLHDNRKGEVYNTRSDWLGFREVPLQALFYFNEPKTISSVTVSTLVDVDGYIMPPQTIEVWGGTSNAQLKLLKRIQPGQPLKDKPNFMEGYDVPFKPVQVSVLKVVAKPVPKLPAWHPGKGDKGWVFVDEVFVN